MLLAAGLPAVVLTTADKARALELLALLRSYGHDALAFDGARVASSQQMIWPRRFHFEADALVCDAPTEQALPYSDIIVLARASHQTRVETTTTEKKKSFSMGRAIVSGGLLLTKTKEKSSTARTDQREEVLYVFHRAGSTPWLVRERGTRYDGLGDKMGPLEHANFVTTVALLREHAPQAAYDDRLVSRKIPERVAQFAAQACGDRRRVETSSEPGMDLLAHLLAAWLSQRPATLA